MIKDEFGDALDTYRATFDEDFPTMDFMGLSTEELTDKIWECIASGNPIETNFDDEIKYETASRGDSFLGFSFVFVKFMRVFSLF